MLGFVPFPRHGAPHTLSLPFPTMFKLCALVELRARARTAPNEDRILSLMFLFFFMSHICRRLFIPLFLVRSGYQDVVGRHGFRA